MKLADKNIYFNSKSLKLYQAWIYIFHVTCKEYKRNIVKNKDDMERCSVIFNLTY